MYQELLLTFSKVDEALKAKALMLAIIIHKRPSINYSEFDYGHQSKFFFTKVIFWSKGEFRGHKDMNIE